MLVSAGFTGVYRSLDRAIQSFSQARIIFT
jgi:hypothetical protein